MFKPKCPGCGKSADRKFSFCPYCGASFKKMKEEEDFGMLGTEDSFEQLFQEAKMPFGLDKIMNSLMKQLQKQMSDMNPNMSSSSMPRGFRIQFSTGKPQIKKVVHNPVQKIPLLEISEQEFDRRRILPREEAKSNVRRLADRIIYEISVPGVKSAKEVIVTNLENSIEVKAYSHDKCFYKSIPLKVEVIGYQIQDSTLFLELKD